ncbi:carboxylate--amine ligase [Halospeciosus flavus]|uniref:Carboxylate--amine ligase n=1 Tax=Halospeciosus flavus TaxID=3032283 RepID=A0ABD5Z708_9EURY|nr:carboxylate--amine ligase [Halospeciosus flavus]
MSDFLTHEELLDELHDHEFDRPPALVSNAHITGLGVARALSAHGVPVIALDRVGDGAAPPSDAVDFAGEVTFPLDDLEGFRDDVEAVAEALDHEPVAFACMDEWVHAYADAEPEGVRLPFADRDVIDAVLNKSSLYRIADELGVPYPETRWLDETSVEDAVADLGLPLVVKPALKREFEEEVGTNVLEVASEEEFRDVVEMADEAGIEVLAQEKVPVERGEDHSLASYVPESGVDDALGVVGNARVRYPQGYGTSCVVETAERPEIEERALDVIAETDYYGISEAEFVYDGEREEFVLLDVNTRPWKWIGLPVAAGANLPMAAYADATGVDYESREQTEARWVSLADYGSLLAETPSFRDVLGREAWLDLLSGAGRTNVAAVFDPDDPEPAYQMLRKELGTSTYYCSC